MAAEPFDVYSRPNASAPEVSPALSAMLQLENSLPAFAQEEKTSKIESRDSEVPGFQEVFGSERLADGPEASAEHVFEDVMDRPPAPGDNSRDQCAQSTIPYSMLLRTDYELPHTSTLFTLS